jgi:nicotinamide-nucleotide amidase
MLIEIISIGDELLRGRIVNTNAAFICRHLHSLGYTVSRQSTLSDEPLALHAGLSEALKRADLVICTGGLGPTLDDRTREIAAELFGSEIHFDQSIADELKSRYAERYFAVQDQARVPKKAKIIPNPVGSAPGLLFSERGQTLLLMPGVPKEMEPMFLKEVMPLIAQLFPQKDSRFTAELNFHLVYESLLDPHLRTLSERYPSVEVGIYPGYGMLNVSLISKEKEQLEGFKKQLLSSFDQYHYLAPSGKLAEALQLVCIQRQIKVAFAESCTGGLLSTLVTAVPGSSDYFLGSFVVYSNAMKERVLGVSSSTLLKKGAVSEETVREMLKGVFEHTSADYAIAVSGIAGPSGGTIEKPVGTIWAAIGKRGESPDIGTFMAYGSRETITLMTSHWLLGALLRKIEKGIPAFPLVKI